MKLISRDKFCIDSYCKNNKQIYLRKFILTYFMNTRLSVSTFFFLRLIIFLDEIKIPSFD